MSYRHIKGIHLWLYVAWQINISNGIATTKIVFSWTWKENKKNANEVFKSENRKFCWVGFSKSIRLDGRLAVRVAAVLIHTNWLVVNSSLT